MNASATLDALSSSANIETQIHGVLISRYTTAAGFVVLFYDFFLTLPDEVRLVWPGPLTFPKFLFYINRYASILLLLVANYHLAGLRSTLPNMLLVLSPKLFQISHGYSCKVWLLIAGTGQIATSISSTALLCLRVTALYAGYTRIVRMIWILFFISYTIGGMFALLSTATLFKTIEYSAITHVCLPNTLGTYLYGIFLAPIAFEVLVVVLTVSKGYHDAILLRSEADVPILYTLVLDGLLYFVVVVAIRIWNSIIWLMFPAYMLYLGLYSDLAIVSTLISRISLNLRSLAHQDALELSSRAVARFLEGDDRPDSMTHGEPNEGL